jgi:hypothetical protein
MLLLSPCELVCVYPKIATARMLSSVPGL